MKIIFYIILFLATTACSNSKSANLASNEIPKDTTKQKIQNTKDATVIITILHYTPYCGGAAPSPEILAQQNQPQRNTSFILINLNTNEKTKVITDTAGILNLVLPVGKYALKETYKDCSFEEFMRQNEKITDEYYQATTNADCYENWWMSYLGEFEITATSPIQEFNWQTRSACFVGRNPCIYYTGPMPP